MKANLHRTKVLTALNQPKAYALLNGFIESKFIGGTGLYMGKDMLAACSRQGFIKEGKAPREIRDKYIGIVWRITDKGRDWLGDAKHHIDTSAERFEAQWKKRREAELKFNVRERARAIARERLNSGGSKEESDG